MLSMRKYIPSGFKNSEEFEKVGNLLNLLSKEIASPFITPVSKLIYIIDELSIAETGFPVTGLDYKVARLGPLATVVYDDIRHANDFFQDFISVTSTPSSCKIQPNSKHAFSDLLFTDYEIELIFRVIKDFGSKSGEELIDYTHREGSPWQLACLKNKIHFSDDDNEPNVTSYFVDFTPLLDSDLKRQDRKSVV